jgi:hypothetical protein
VPACLSYFFCTVKRTSFVLRSIQSAMSSMTSSLRIVQPSPNCFASAPVSNPPMPLPDVESEWKNSTTNRA